METTAVRDNYICADTETTKTKLPTTLPPKACKMLGLPINTRTDAKLMRIL